MLEWMKIAALYLKVQSHLECAWCSLWKTTLDNAVKPLCWLHVLRPILRFEQKLCTDYLAFGSETDNLLYSDLMCRVIDSLQATQEVLLCLEYCSQICLRDVLWYAQDRASAHAHEFAWLEGYKLLSPLRAQIPLLYIDFYIRIYNLE